MKVSEVANITGVSVRTLHYYDEIGLLKPASIAENGYRLYSDGNLQQLQQILFFRELDFSLQAIKQFMFNPHFDAVDALEAHRHTLIKEQARLAQLVQTIDQTILEQKGEINMTNEARFKGFDFSKKEYETEARNKWGDEAVNYTNKKIADHPNIQDKMNERFKALAKLQHVNPSSNEAQKEIAAWFNDLNEIGNYSIDAFQSLGEMYVEDERFKNNIDQFGEGLAAFLQKAMKCFAENNNNGLK